MIFIKPGYSCLKWGRERNEREKVGGVSLNIKNIDFLTNVYKYPEETKRKYKACPSVDDPVTLYCLISYEYRSLAETEWIVNSDFEKCAADLYLYLLSQCRAYELYKQGITITNNAVKNAVLNKEWNSHLLYTAISLNETGAVGDCICTDCAVYSLLCGDTERAEFFINKLPDNADDNAVNFEDEEYLKKLLEAVIAGDEAGFNREIASRIKRLRQKEVGYLTVIDVTSIALIKLARQYDISYDRRFIEIPDGFLENININKECLKLPDIGL